MSFAIKKYLPKKKKKRERDSAELDEVGWGLILKGVLLTSEYLLLQNGFLNVRLLVKILMNYSFIKKFITYRANLEPRSTIQDKEI